MAGIYDIFNKIFDSNRNKIKVDAELSGSILGIGYGSKFF